MKNILPLVYIFLFLIMTSCVVLNETKAPSSSQITTWLTNQQFGKALDALNMQYNISPTTELATQIKLVIDQANDFDRESSRDINRLINEHKLILASERLTSALSLHPNGKQLLITQKRLRNTQRTRVSRLQATQLLAKAEWLLKARKIENSLLKIKQKAENSTDDLIVESNDIQETAAELYHLGLKATQKGDFELADSTLTMSNKLFKRNFTTSALARLKQLTDKHNQERLNLIRQENKRKSIRLAIKRKQHDELKKETNKYEFNVIYFKTKSMLKDNQLSAAKTNLDRLEQLIPGEKRLLVLNTTFAKKLPEHIKALINRGRQFYINGKIRKARNIWYKALILSPRNEQIIENINRANKVLGRLNELKGKGKGKEKEKNNN
ncbi:MAG: hypothetical protein GXP13_05495 [Gammaproteobacteria bacterium]|nr:hypothetical protein [Gammaproteobacteria bacterium]